MKMTSFRRSRNARVFLLLPEPACGGYLSADGVGLVLPKIEVCESRISECRRGRE